MPHTETLDARLYSAGKARGTKLGADVARQVGAYFEMEKRRTNFTREVAAGTVTFLTVSTLISRGRGSSTVLLPCDGWGDW